MNEGNPGVPVDPFLHASYLIKIVEVNQGGCSKWQLARTYDRDMETLDGKSARRHFMEITYFKRS